MMSLVSGSRASQQTGEDDKSRPVASAPKCSWVEGVFSVVSKLCQDLYINNLDANFLFRFPLKEQTPDMMKVDEGSRLPLWSLMTVDIKEKKPDERLSPQKLNLRLTFSRSHQLPQSSRRWQHITPTAIQPERETHRKRHSGTAVIAVASQQEESLFVVMACSPVSLRGFPHSSLLPQSRDVQVTLMKTIRAQRHFGMWTGGAGD
ncbi:unnamed protein product [Pleuronectes platessa]|uniref:Uncharacterized protein n=1 Tax=Pleuronectes platessa TaxID=8262 RepID=A0A9N7V3Y1_PLEPL|nr:unnamed protein product [Pleuronectes platessa]